jgi:cyclophilin family peptidyl-prolyl cis-trans isomerase
VYIPEGYVALEPLSQQRQTNFRKAEQVLEPGKDYRAVIETTKGRIVLDLFQDDAPNTVNNFVFLARHKFYNGVLFHRVLDGFMAQTGDPTGSGRGGPGYKFADETDNGRTHNAKGMLSMANAGPNTNGSQFFITFSAQSHLDGRHTVFGEVIDGLEVLDELQRIDPMRPSGVKADAMTQVYIVEKVTS